jgi:hypothetical protein
VCCNGFWICGTNEVALHYVIKENTFWMRVLTEPEPQQPKFGPKIITIDASDDESLDENCKGNSSLNVSRYKIICGHNLGNFFLSLWSYKKKKFFLHFYYFLHKQ